MALSLAEKLKLLDKEKIPPAKKVSPIMDNVVMKGLESIGGAMGEVGKGITKFAGETAAGMSSLGEKMLQAPVQAIKGGSFKPTLGEQLKEKGTFEAEGGLQKAGKFGAELASYMLPGAAPAKFAGAASKAAISSLPTALMAGKGVLPTMAKGLVQTGTKAVTEAAAVGGQTAIQKGEVGEEAGSAAMFGAAIPVAGSLLKAAGKVFTPVVSKAVEEGINKGIKPYFTGMKTAGAREGYLARAKEAIKTIAESKPSFTSAEGVVEQRLPRNRSELLEAIDQAKKKIYTQYHSQAVQAGESGAYFRPELTLNKLKEIPNDLSHSPEVRSYAKKLYNDLIELGGATPTEVEPRIADLNNSLSSYYAGGRVDRAKAQVDASVAVLMREELDRAIESTSGSGYQALKNKYGALKTIEKDVARQVAVEARKNSKGLIDFTDIFTGGDILAGALTLNPTLFARGLAGKAIKETFKGLNDPNRYIRKMFEALSREEKPVTSAIGQRIFGMPERVPGQAAMARGPGASGAEMVGR